MVVHGLFFLLGQPSNNCLSRTLTLAFVCDELNKIGSASCSETITCNYAFTFYTSYACDSNTNGSASSTSTDGLSGGSIFLLILFLCLFVYCVAGYAYNTRKNQDGGWKDYKNNIPNLGFWCMVPQWTKAGCMVTKEYIMEKYQAYKNRSGNSSSDQPKVDDNM